VPRVRPIEFHTYPISLPNGWMQEATHYTAWRMSRHVSPITKETRTVANCYCTTALPPPRPHYPRMPRYATTDYSTYDTHISISRIQSRSRYRTVDFLYLHLFHRHRPRLHASTLAINQRTLNPNLCCTLFRLYSLI